MNRTLRLLCVSAALAVACRPHAPVAVLPTPSTGGAQSRPDAPRTGDGAPVAGAAAGPGIAPARRVAGPFAPELTREFRGVWVATVANIDWPSSRALSTAQQQKELLDLLDRAAALKLNAVIFQVRPAADALYDSKIEPWSEYLTGTQGQPPAPFWDPLEFAVRQAHARNLELHAWFNPYRARQTGAHSALARTHIAKTNPSLVKRYGEMLWMDPGEKAVRDRTLRVVLDVVKRYDVDGIHLDDYFYPYPEAKRGKEIPFPDNVSYKRYRKTGGTLGRADWRRQNVDLLVKALDEGIHKVKPWVRFGISPFGIWRPGYPSQIRGFDSYEKLYADAKKWLNEGWVDYFTPQLYWPTTKAEQSYPVLLQWWSHENTLSRHLWPGNFTSRAGGTGSSAISVAELVEQIRVTRLQAGATGNVHFSMKSFLTNQGRMNDTLSAGPYASLAIVPATPWLKSPTPPVPALQITSRNALIAVELGTTRKAMPWQWLVQVRTDTGWTSTLLPGAATSYSIPAGILATDVTVRAFNRVGVESPPISVSLSVSQSSGHAAAQDPSHQSITRGRSDGH